MPTADGVPRNHGDDRLGDAAHQDLKIEDVEASDAALGDLVVADVAVVTPDLLVPARAEGVRALAAEDDGADIGVVPGHGEGVRQLEERLRTEGVAPLRAANRQLRDALSDVVADVLERTSRLPRWKGKRAEIVEGIMRTSCDHGLHGDLRYWPVPELVALDLPGGVGFVDALQAIWDTGDAAAPLDPRLPPLARQVLLDALRPTRIVGSDGEQRALPDGIGVEDGDALVVATSGTSGSSVVPRASCSPMTPSPPRRRQPRPGSASTRPGTRGWPACRSLTSGGSRS